jgi:hypothetical protein
MVVFMKIALKLMSAVIVILQYGKVSGAQCFNVMYEKELTSKIVDHLIITVENG